MQVDESKVKGLEGIITEARNIREKQIKTKQEIPDNEK